MAKTQMICLCILLFFGGMVYAQKQITGTVGDANGPLPGASVILKGTTVGTTTDFDGNYTITLQGGQDVLQFSYVGYLTKEIQVGTQTVVNVTLEENAEVLQEVVVTAQGIKKSKKALGYAIANVRPDEVEKRPEADMARALQGKVAGVSITPADGQTGSSSEIRIRGNVSLTGTNSPLIVVNNVPFNGLLRDIDPNDIESISILKGFNASVLYGSEGRNGVILIQTKSGSARTGEVRTTASYSTTVYSNTVSQLPEFQNTYSNGLEGVQFDPTILSNFGPAFSTLGEVAHPYASLAQIFPEFEGATVQIAAKPDNVRNIFRMGIGTTHSFTFAASKEKVGFNLSAGYADEQGIIDHNDLKRFNLSVGGKAQLTDKLNVSANIGYSTRKVNLVNDESIFSVVYHLPRWIDLTELPYQNPLTGESVYYRNDTNPLWILHNSGNYDDKIRVFGNVAADYQIAESLNLTYRVGFDSETYMGFDYSNKGGYSDDSFRNGYLNLGDSKEVIINQTALLGYNKDLFKNFNLEAQLGMNSQLTRYTGNSTSSDGQIVYGFLRPSNFTTTEASYTHTEENLAGAFAQLQFAYKNYLYATFSGRNDWGSTVELDNRSLFYPGASFSFIPTSALNFGGNTINYLKFRYAYATSSGYPAPYRTRSTLIIDPLRFAAADGTYPITNRYSTRYANLNLKPELHKEVEVGMEAKLFHNRVSLEASAYIRVSKDQIVESPLAPSTGYDDQYINLGRIDNEGVEVDLGIDMFRGENFRWNLRNIFTADESLVVETTPTRADINITEDRFAVEGQPFGVIKGDYALRDENGNLLISGNGSSTRVGEVITSSDIGLETKVIGDPNPDWRLTTINSIGIKKFSISAQLEYTHGGEIYSSSVANMLQRGVAKETEDREGSFIIPGYLADDETGELLLDANGDQIPNTIQINSGRVGFSNYYNANDLAMWDTSIFRLREVALGYTLSPKKGERLPFQRIDFTLSGRNLWYRAPNFPKYVNYDPESDGLEGDSTVPSTKRFAFGVSVTF
ncbi:TonB-linked outer membrane protein, SusC/RagA family [Flagellimonas taeanensis]|uniref:TonB-linked outer membrane protein, SusC/RagA family n=2 Tax=Flagellimonas taeanensis TaxID=1005926 RepID=A0A1M6RLJ5_9FLAO|nr:TonB-linked outer membrane protein, SusC/RagA family [Allomuricauda taeanensis]SHK33333.1 TonB-linked outer membrane protein, SusC/RagA family [Allomuricauda taeanensis]